MDKREAREQGLFLRKQIPADERNRRSAKLKDAVLPELMPYSMIGCYVSIHSEADTRSLIEELLKQGRRVCIPRTYPQELKFYEIHDLNETVPGVMGIPEPAEACREIDPSEIECMIVPLSACDPYFHRTGYGAGYYDRYLQKHMHKIGIGFREQLMDRIETEEHDVSLNELILE